MNPCDTVISVIFTPRTTNARRRVCDTRMLSNSKRFYQASFCGVNIQSEHFYTYTRTKNDRGVEHIHKYLH